MSTRVCDASFKPTAVLWRGDHACSRLVSKNRLLERHLLPAKTVCHELITEGLAFLCPTRGTRGHLKCTVCDAGEEVLRLSSSDFFG